MTARERKKELEEQIQRLIAEKKKLEEERQLQEAKTEPAKREELVGQHFPPP